MNADTESCAQDEYLLPPAEALLAGTLALMTGHAQAGDEARRRLMADKIVANLAQLTGDPTLSDAFKRALWKLGCHWQVMHPAPAARPDLHLWHARAATLQ